MSTFVLNEHIHKEHPLPRRLKYLVQMMMKGPRMKRRMMRYKDTRRLKMQKMRKGSKKRPKMKKLVKRRLKEAKWKR